MNYTTQSILSSSAEGFHRRAHLNPLGNWCEHNPSNPRFFKSPQSHGVRPDAICIAAENIQNFYKNPRAWLNSLLAVNESVRQERSEGRERDGVVIQVLLHYAELASLRVGVPCHDDNAFRNLSLKFIAEKAGFRKAGDHPDKGIKRTWRAIRRLAKAGYIDIYRRFDQYISDEGLNKYKGLPAVKRITPKLFVELGVSLHRLEFRRRQARNRLNRRIAAERKTTQNYLDKLTQKNGQGYRRYQKANRDQEEFAKRKKALEFLYKLMEMYPEASPRELQKQYAVRLE